MNRQEIHEQQAGWVTICKRVYLWEEPDSYILVSLGAKGSSDSGELEWNGSVLRFNGKEKQIEMPEIKDVSEIRARFRLSHFFFFWLHLSAVLLLISTVFYLIPPSGSFTWQVILSQILAFTGTIGVWLYFRKYGRWACITYGASEEELGQLYFLSPPISGGSHRLYKTLHKKLMPPQVHERVE